MGFVSLVAAFTSVFLAVQCVLKIMRSSKNRSRCPPSMKSLPIFGSLPFIADLANIHKTFAEKAKHLGSVFSCYIGSRYTVILNDKQSIREAFLRRGSAFSDREVIFLMKNYFNVKCKGILQHSYDAEFIRHHQVILGILKDAGMGQIGMEQRTQREIEELILHIREVEGKSFDPAETIQLCILNVIYTLLFGKRTPQTDPDLKHLLGILSKTAANYPAVVNHFPLLRFVPYYHECIQTVLHCIEEQRKFIGEKIELCLKEETKETSLVVAFSEKEALNYDRDNLTEVVRQLIIGGSETTTLTVLWALSLLANRPELRKRLHDELDSVVPSDRMPCIGDVAQLPLTEATVLEVMRLKTLVPLAVPHRTTCDTEVAGFYIPRDTVVYPNLYAVHMDVDEWGDPDVFRPERFLDESGTRVVGRNRLMPFSIGKRSCIGEGIARPEILMVISSLVQQFDIYPATGKDKVECQESTFLTTRPSAFEVRLVPRKAINS